MVCAAGAGEEVARQLAEQVGVVEVTRTAGAGVPGGEDREVVEATVARTVAQQTVDLLDRLGVTGEGEISLTSPDLVLSQRAHEAATVAPGDADDAVLWDELVADTGEDSTLTPAFLAFLTLGSLLAAVGVLTDSAVTIVGAMVVSPDFGPLAALSVAAVRRRGDLARSAGRAIVLGWPVAIVVTALVGLLLRWAGLWEPGDLTDLGDVSFVYQVGPYSVIVALLAGAAGMLALTAMKSGTLLGVFISVTTVPAAGFAALAAVAGDWGRCGEALLQLGVNMAGVVLAGAVTLWLRRHHVRTGGHGRTGASRGDVGR